MASGQGNHYLWKKVSYTPSLEQVQMQFQRVSSVYFILLFLGLLSLIAYMIWPFMSALMFAGILGGTFKPVTDWLIKKMDMRPSLAGIITCLGIILLLFIPMVWLGIKLSQEAFNLYETIQSTVSREWIDEIFFGDHWIAQKSRSLFASMNMEYSFEALEKLIVEAAKSVSLMIFETINSWLSNVFSFLFQFIIMIILTYTFLVNGTAIKDYMFHLSPLPQEEEGQLLLSFNQMNYVTLVCNGLGGVIQGVLAGIGFWIAGIGSVLLWSTAMIILAFIPIVGISIIYIPASIYLLAHGDLLAGVLLFIYCTAISLVVENWFKPMFIGKRVEINSIILFFSIIGGMAAFGMGGIFYGPLIATLFLSFVKLYFEKFEVDRSEKESLFIERRKRGRRKEDRHDFDPERG